ncbi:glycosyltransferase family 39 protein [bacterium]|nr:glycosyltransferase family 39 protein [bacterium]
MRRLEQGLKGPNILIRIGPAVLMLVILAAGAAGRAIAVYDEGHFLLAAHTIAEGIRGIFSGNSIAEIRDAIHQGGGTLYFAAKPGYIFILAFLDLLTGGLTSGRALALSVLCGVGVVALTQSIAEKRFGWRTGLYAGLLVALNPLVLQFGRMALGVEPAVFLALLAFWIMEHADGKAWRAALAGAVAFAAFTCHYNVAPLMLALGIGAWPLWSRRTRIALIAGGIVSAGLFEGALLGVDFVLRNAYPDFRSFFGELYYNFAVHQVAGGEEAVIAAGAAESTDGVRGYGAAAWFYLIGTLAAGMHWLLIVGVVGLIWMKREPIIEGSDQRLLLWWTLFPLVVWSLYPWKVERSFLNVVPGIAVLAAVVLDRFQERWNRAGQEGEANAVWKALGWFPIAMVLLTAVLLSIPQLSPDPSGQRRLVMNNRDWIASLPRGSFTATSFNWRSAPIWKWYLGPELHRMDIETPGIDFSSFDLPLYAAQDPQSALPDPGYAAQEPEFEGAQPVLELRDDPAFAFLRRPQNPRPQ